MNIVKIGSVELTEQEAQQYFEQGKYIVTYSRIYQITRRAGSYYGKIVHTSKGMTRPGRFYAMDARTVNDVFDLSLS